MSNHFQVTEAGTLMDLLSTRLQGWSRTNIKKRLQGGCICINGEVVTQYNFQLQIGDAVEVLALGEGSKVRRKACLLKILYSDDDLVVIDKPAGLLSVASAAQNKRHALALLRAQLSRPRHPMRLWPVHRLDRETSGVLLFATSREIRELISESWSEAEKTYLAVVDGVPDPTSGTIDQPLRMDAEKLRAQVGAHPGAKSAITHFETLRSEKGRTLLQVNIETGRQHQIRAHLAWLGHPVVGDERYGHGSPPMGLHALRLSIPCPATGKRLTFEAPVPAEFSALLGESESA